jgi:hypothetical protein
VVANVPVETLWPRLESALEKINRGDPRGVEAVYAVISTEDAAWLDRNAGALAAILTPTLKIGAPAQAKLIALQALARSMPRSVGPAPVVKTNDYGFGVAKVTERPEHGGRQFTTPIVQEYGRWVVARFFFARDFVWVPQLAAFKRAKNIPLTPDELQFLTAGFAPLQEQARQAYRSVGLGE